jgi:hypothetical protein
VLTGYVFKPEAPETSHFVVRWPKGERPVGPQVIIEEISERNAGGVGSASRQIQYRLILRAAEVGADGLVINSDEFLSCWKERIIRHLHGKQIPYYDYRTLEFPATFTAPIAYPDKGFSVYYESASRPSEEVDQWKNTLVLVISVKI